MGRNCPGGIGLGMDMAGDTELICGGKLNSGKSHQHCRHSYHNTGELLFSVKQKPAETAYNSGYESHRLSG
jgi:hypothetical protein